METHKRLHRKVKADMSITEAFLCRSKFKLLTGIKANNKHVKNKPDIKHWKSKMGENNTSIPLLGNEKE